MTLPVCPKAAPNPVEDRPRAEPDRNLDCAHYDSCLSVACRMNWNGFACSKCPVNGGTPDAAALLEEQEANPKQAGGARGHYTPKNGLRAAVLGTLAAGGSWTADAVAERIERPLKRVSTELCRLTEAGRIRRVSLGLYEAIQ